MLYPRNRARRNVSHRARAAFGGLRIYAGNPERDFRPSADLISGYHLSLLGDGEPYPHDSRS